MAYDNVRTDQEIEDLIGDIAMAEATGQSKYPGSTYEAGVRAAVDWLIGDSDDHPYEG